MSEDVTTITLTAEDLERNPTLVEAGLKAGDTYTPDENFIAAEEPAAETKE